MLLPGATGYTDIADPTPFNNSPYTGVTTTTLTITEASRSLDGNRYYAVATSDLGEATSGSATLNVEFAPTISAHPSNRSIVAGQTTSFSVTAAPTVATYRWQILPVGASAWSDVANGGAYSGAETSVLSISNATLALNGAQYRVVVTNSLGTATSSSATLTVFGSLTVTPSSLRLAAIKGGASGQTVAVTAPQTVTISTTVPTAWTAAADKNWVQLSTGSGVLTVAVNPNNVLGSSGTVTSAITITPATAGMAARTVTVTLVITPATTDAAAPFGQVDTPAQASTGLVGAIGITGWALDNIGVTGVKVYRSCLSFDNQANCQSVLGQSVVYIGDAAFLAGARPDVEAVFPIHPQAHRAGWGMQVLSNMLPHVPSQQAYGGHGALSFYAFATDEQGNLTLLGRSRHDQTPTSVTLANESIAKPFGTLDTPAQGGTVSGNLANFGWVLTPDTNATADSTDILMPTDGSTMQVFIDGVAMGNVAYNQCRGNVGNPVPSGVYCNDDIANIFGQTTQQPTFTFRTSNPTLYRNLDAVRAAIGAFNINTLNLTNGIHSIAWGVTDSAGRTEGIGSRNFFVLNSGSDAAVPPRLKPQGSDRLEQPGSDRADQPGSDQSEPRGFSHGGAMAARLLGRRGFDLAEPFVEIALDPAGERHVQIGQMDRLELQLGAGITRGYLVANGTERELPAGSHLDPATGTFTWAPAPGFLGTYRLVFVTAGSNRLRQGYGESAAASAKAEDPASIRINVTIRAPRETPVGESEIRMHVDSPAPDAVVSRAFTIAGWSLDPQAFTGSGIGAIHVWARRLDRPTAGPEFVGAATIGVARSDVAAAFGPGYHDAGYQLTATLALGLYELTVYAWNHRTARWEDARSVRVTVRP